MKLVIISPDIFFFGIGSDIYIYWSFIWRSIWLANFGYWIFINECKDKKWEEK